MLLLKSDLAANFALEVKRTFGFVFRS